MNSSTFTALLTRITLLFTVCCLFMIGCLVTNGIAETETVPGKIAMDPPNVPVPKVVINFNQTFFNLFINFGIASIRNSDGDQPVGLASYTEYANMLKGAAVRAYSKEAEDLNEIIGYYQGLLADGKWQQIIKVTNKFNLSLLYAEETGVLHGIFAMIIDDESWNFANIYGEIDFQKLGVLFGRVIASSSEVEMSKTIRDWVSIPNSPWGAAEIDPEKHDETPKAESETCDEALESETETTDSSNSK